MRAAMKPLPTLMKPLASVDLATGEEATALVERSDVAAVEALAVVAEAAVAWELAVLALDKFGGDAVEDFVAAYARVRRAHRMALNALGRHLALIGFMGAGKTTIAPERRCERSIGSWSSSTRRSPARPGEVVGAFGSKGEVFFRAAGGQARARRARRPRASRVSFGGGAVTSPSVREALARDRVHGPARRRAGRGVATGRRHASARAGRAAVPQPLRRAGSALPGDRGRGRRERRLGRPSCWPRPVCTTSAARSSGSASSCRATAPSRSSPTRP